MRNLFVSLAAVGQLSLLYFLLGLLFPQLPLLKTRGRAAKFIGLSFGYLIVLSAINCAMLTPEEWARQVAIAQAASQPRAIERREQSETVAVQLPTLLAAYKDN